MMKKGKLLCPKCDGVVFEIRKDPTAYKCLECNTEYLIDSKNKLYEDEIYNDEDYINLEFSMKKLPRKQYIFKINDSFVGIDWWGDKEKAAQILSLIFDSAPLEPQKIIKKKLQHFNLVVMGEKK